MNRNAALFLLISLLAGTSGACGKKEPAAAPPVAPTPTEAPAMVPAVEQEIPRPRPSVLVYVDGGPDDRTIWRGWPVIIQASILEGDAKAELTIRGPSAVTPERRASVWVIPPAASRQLAPGAYIFSVGSGSTEVTVSDPPAALSPAQSAMQRRLSAYADLELGNRDGALKSARDWVAAEPKSAEAQGVLGDALRASGDRAGAAAAYDEAIRLIPPGVHPPASLLARVTDLQREELDALPGKPVNPDDTEYYQQVAAAAAAVKSGNRAEAERTTSAAEAVHRDRKLLISNHELKELRTAIDALPAAPAKGEPPVAPKKPDAPKADPPKAEPTTPPKKPAEGKVGPPSAGVVVPAADLTDEKVRADAAGQWAATATAGSQYGKTQYSPAKATGAPDVAAVGNSPDAWCPAGKDAGTDWLEVAFTTPVAAIEVRVRQNDTSGAISKIEALEPDGTVHVWWEGVDPLAAKPVRDIVWFAVRVPKTSYLVAKVKVTLNLAAVPGWKEIDAVQLVGAAP